MSRVGKYPVIIPEGVSASVYGNVVNVKGKLGELSFAYDDSHVNVEINDGKIVVMSCEIQDETIILIKGTYSLEDKTQHF